MLIDLFTYCVLFNCPMLSLCSLRIKIVKQLLEKSTSPFFFLNYAFLLFCAFIFITKNILSHCVQKLCIYICACILLKMGIFICKTNGLLWFWNLPLYISMPSYILKKFREKNWVCPNLNIIVWTNNKK